MGDTWELINHPMSDETGLELAAQMKRQNDILAGIAAGTAGAEFVDATFRGLLDGKNTTEIFWSWWPLSAGDGVTKYQRLERFAKMLAESARGKTYTVRFYSDDVSGDYTGTPLDDLADGREAAPLLTDASPETADWSEEDPFTWYIRANALSLEDGTMNVLAVEGETGFDLSGETAPVYCFALSLTLKEWEDGAYLYNSFRAFEGGGYDPMAGDVAPDKSRRDDAAHQHERRGKAGAADAGILDQADNAGDKHHNTKNVADPEQTGLGHDEQQHTDDDIREAQQQHSVFDIAQHSERLLFTCRLPA